MKINLSTVTSLLLALGVSGCGSSKTTSFRVVGATRVEHPADASELKIEKGQRIFVDAKPIGTLTNPKFPSGSFAVPRSALVITVQVRVDENGRATVLGKSVRDVSMRTPFTVACEETIASAVAEWRFEPAQIAILEPQKGGQPMVVASEAIDTTFDVAFVFDPSGTSRSTLRE